MGYSINKFSICTKDGVRIDIDYDENAKVFFNEDGGHCGGCSEDYDTKAVTMKEVNDMCCNRDKWIEDLNRNLIKKYEEEIVQYKKEISKLKEKNTSLEDEVETVRDVIAKALGEDSKKSDIKNQNC